MAIGILCIHTVLWAGSRPFVVQSAERVAECNAVFIASGNDSMIPSGGSSLRVDVPAVVAALGNVGTVELAHFPIATHQMGSVVLRRLRPVVDANTQLYIGNNPAPMPSVQRYVGSVRGEQGSKVFVCVVGSAVIASVERGDGTVYTLAPALGKSGSNEYIMANEAVDASSVASFVCSSENAAAQMPLEHVPAVPTKRPHILSDKLLEVKVAVEADTRFFQRTGGTVEKATTYLVALMSLASVVYEDELNTTLYLPWIKVWTDNPADPYQADGDGYALAPKALEYWNDNHRDVKRDLVHVLTAGGGGGIGYLTPIAGGGGKTTLCTNSGLGASSPFADHTFPTLAFTYGVYIVAHEMGHSFGAVHSHKCFWNPPLDTCMTQDDATFQANDACYKLPITPRANSGSIMSYCPSLNKAKGKGYGVEMTFLPRIAAYMREQVEQAACVTEPPQPTVVLTAPRGGTSFTPTDAIVLTWLSARVDAVSLSYSTDGGQQWTPIATAVPVGEKSTTWKPTGICSNKVLVRIADVANSAVADTSIVPFTIVGPHPECLVAHYPIEGDARDVRCGFFTATNEGAVLTADRNGKPNSAFQFDGSARLVAPNFAFAAEEMTATFWFRTSDLSSVETIIGTNWEQEGVLHTYVWNGTFGCSFWVQGQSAPVQAWSKAVKKDTWYFGAISYDGTTVKIYLDGQLTGSTEKQGVLKSASGLFPLYLGARGGKEYLRGVIDDVRLYCRALPADDILALMNQPTAPQQAPELIAPIDKDYRIITENETPVALQWGSVALAQAYHLQVAVNEDMQTDMVLDKADIQDTTFTHGMLMGNFYWRVAARNSAGSGPWSVVRSFFLYPSLSVGETKELQMVSVYPNPCAEQAVLSYRTAAPGVVRVVLCNIFGQEVQHVESGWTEPGIHTAVVPVADIVLGVYFVKISHGTTTLVQRIVVMR